MAKQKLKLDRFEGVSTVISKEDRPIALVQSMVNLRPHRIVGRAVKRSGYDSKLSSGITNGKSIIEFENKNGDNTLMLLDSSTLKESTNTSGTYSTLAAPSNDDRTAGSTIESNSFNPIIINKELRAGAGNTASTERPLWCGYYTSKSRYNSAVNITDGKYLDLQSYKSLFKTNLLSDVNSSVGANTNTSGGYNSANGSYLIAYASPVYDGYQKGFPFLLDPFNEDTDFAANLLYTNTNLDLEIKISTANAQALKRVTALDIFVAVVNTKEDWINKPAYFVGRIDMNSQGDYFLEQSGTLDSTAETITIATATDWHTFSLNEVWCYDATNDKTYLVDTDLDSSGSRVLTVRSEGDTITDNGAASLKFFFGWFSNGGFYWYYFKSDNFYIQAQSEMFDYLGIPVGNTGIADWRYKYSAWNGFRAIYGGFPTDDNFSYMSITENPDIVPSTNIYRHKSAVKGYETVDNDFIVFTKTGIERLSYVGSNIDQNDEYLDAILASTKSIVKINDNEIAFMAYDGVYLISGRRVIYVGEALKTWWLDTLTDAQKEACVAGYNDRNNELWFSFPTYTDSVFTAGFIAVFDLESYKKNAISGWWFVKTDKAIVDFTQNTQNHMLGLDATSLIDFDGAGSETVSTSFKLKMLENYIPGRKVRFGRLFIGASTSDTISCNLYFDESASAVSLTLNSDLNGLIRYLANTLEIEVTTPASVNSVEHTGLTLTFQPMGIK